MQPYHRLDFGLNYKKKNGAKKYGQFLFIMFTIDETLSLFIFKILQTIILSLLRQNKLVYFLLFQL